MVIPLLLKTGNSVCKSPGRIVEPFMTTELNKAY